MAPPSSTTITTSPPASPTGRTRDGTPIGSLFLVSPTEGKPSDGFGLSLKEEPHDFRPPCVGASRSPCPALNTLAAHGYLPRDGHNITWTHLLDALQNPDVYNISGPLAMVLAYGGRFLMQAKGPISLHELSAHGRIEHDASLVHKNTATGHIHAPTRCDTVLLDELLKDNDFLTLDDVARRRSLLEKVSDLDAVHKEIARGEWALVLGIFGKAHGGKVPADQLRVWLKENRLPDGWKPTHQQQLFDTIKISGAIREKMDEYHRSEGVEGMSAQECAVEDIVKRELETNPEESAKGQ